MSGEIPLKGSYVDTRQMQNVGVWRVTSGANHYIVSLLFCRKILRQHQLYSFDYFIADEMPVLEYCGDGHSSLSFPPLHFSISLFLLSNPNGGYIVEELAAGGSRICCQSRAYF